MQANQTPVVWTVVIAAVVLLVVGLFSAVGINSNLKLASEKLDGFDIDENALANAIVAGIVIPEVTVPEFDTEKLDELWNAMNGPQYCENNFVDDVEAFALDEFDADDAITKLELGILYPGFDELVGDFELDEIEVTSPVFGGCELDDYTSLDDDDRSANVVITYDFKYSKAGKPIGHVYEGSITLTQTYSQDYDDVDEEYEDAKVTVPTYSLI